MHLPCVPFQTWHNEISVCSNPLPGHVVLDDGDRGKELRKLMEGIEDDLPNEVNIVFFIRDVKKCVCGRDVEWQLNLPPFERTRPAPRNSSR
jgi:hypothetical protein